MTRNLLAALIASSILYAVPAWADCHIAGDCIALGISQQLGGCTASAKVGISSTAIVSRVRPAGLVIISMGSNDPTNPRLGANVADACRRAGSGVKKFALPIHPVARVVVAHAAAACGAGTLSFVAGRDNVHPRSYGPLSRAALK